MIPADSDSVTPTAREIFEEILRIECAAVVAVSDISPQLGPRIDYGSPLQP